MSGPPTLAVVAASGVHGGVEEFLRVCVGVVAGGGGLTLLEVGEAAGLLGGDQDGPGEMERHLEGLAGFDVRPRPVSGEELRELLSGTDRVIRVADPARVGVPRVLMISDAYLESVDPDRLISDITTAGQVIRI